MKISFLLSIGLTSALLTACGGSGGSDEQTDNQSAYSSNNTVNSSNTANSNTESSVSNTAPSNSSNSESEANTSNNSATNSETNNAVGVEVETSSNNPIQPSAMRLHWFASNYNTYPVNINLAWTMDWGNNGERWYAYVNGEEVTSQALSNSSPNAQSASTNINLSMPGTYTLSVKLCNGTGQKILCSEASQEVYLAGANNANSGTENTTEQGNTEEAITEENSQTLPTTGAHLNEFNQAFTQDSGKVVGTYFVEWSIYGRNYHVNDIPAQNLTHLIFGFIAICGDNPHASGGARAAITQECADKQDYEVTMIDRFANLEKTYPGDTWIDDTSGDEYNGNFGAMKKMKAAHPHIKILPSIGGWTLSTPFYEMASNDAYRARFVASAVNFIKKYDFFDGLDIDWEYPVIGGTDPALSSEQDSQGYTVLMRDLRAALDALSEETGRTYELTSAVGAAPDRIAALNYSAATRYMDYIFLMSYDFMGSWGSTTGHHSPLYNNNELIDGYNTHDAVQNLLSNGVPASKLVVGAAMYGRGWQSTQNTGTHAPDMFPIYGNASGPSAGTWEAGVYDYKDLYTRFIGQEGLGINGFEARYDSTAQAAYLWNESSGEFISYDNARSVKAKADLVLNMDLGGMFSWEIDADNGHILNAMNEGMGNSPVH